MDQQSMVWVENNRRYTIRRQDSDSKNGVKRVSTFTEGAEWSHGLDDPDMTIRGGGDQAMQVSKIRLAVLDGIAVNIREGSSRSS